MDGPNDTEKLKVRYSIDKPRRRAPLRFIRLWPPWRLRRPSSACAAFISDREAVQATIWAALFVWGQPRASLCDRRRSARPAGRSQKKLNRAQCSGISTSQDYKPVMQRWSSQRQRYRPCPDAPGWPAISSCSPGARQPFLRRPSAVHLCSFLFVPASMSIVSHGAVSRSCSIPRYRSVVLILECP